MLKNTVRLDHQEKDKFVHLFCEVDCPLEVLRNALFQFIKYCAYVEDSVKAQQQAQQESQKAEEEKSKVENLPVEDHAVNVEQSPQE